MPGLGLTPRQRLGIGLGAFCGGMIVAKLPFVLADWEGQVDGRAWFDNGKTIVFGLVGGYFGVELAKWALGIRVKTGDGFAVPVAAVAIGRPACFCTVMYAVGRGNASIVRFLMNYGAAHHHEYFDDRPLLAEAARRGHVEVVKLLIECGADLNAVGKDGLTALTWATKEGHDTVVKHLIQAGAVR
jgi:hypothetical protein